MLDTFPDVTDGFKNRLPKPNSPILCCSVFQTVFLGYCQTTVNSVFREVLQLRSGSTTRRSGTEHRLLRRGHRQPVLLLPLCIRDLVAGQGERALGGVGEILLFGFEVRFATVRDLTETLLDGLLDLLGDDL